MTFVIEIAPLAQADLDDIEDWLAGSAGPRVAARVVERVFNRITRLAKDALTGTRRPEYGANTWFVVTRPYVIYFDVSETQVLVLRILHTARDRDAIMRGVQEEASSFEMTA